MNTYVNPIDAQRRLDIFSEVKAATLVPAVEANNTESDGDSEDEKLSEVSID